MEEFEKALKGELKRLGLWKWLLPSDIERLSKHFNLMLQWNRSASLTAIEDAQRAAVELYADSLAALPVIVKTVNKGTVLDIGSGAGFPGLVLAVALKERGFVLAERSAKKSAFLRYAVRLLGLAHRVRIVEHDVKRGAIPSGHWGVVLSRATFADLSYLEWLLPAVEPNGVIVAYLTKRQRRVLLRSEFGKAVVAEFAYKLTGLDETRFTIAIGNKTLHSNG